MIMIRHTLLSIMTRHISTLQLFAKWGAKMHNSECFSSLNPG